MKKKRLVLILFDYLIHFALLSLFVVAFLLNDSVLSSWIKQNKYIDIFITKYINIFVDKYIDMFILKNILFTDAERDECVDGAVEVYIFMVIFRWFNTKYCLTN